MGGFLRQATASQAVALGPFLDDTDFKTPETGLTIANTDIKLVVNGGASANKNSGGGTHRVNGVYGVTFDATDTATVGEMQVSVAVTGALPVFDKFFVIEEAVYDRDYAASALGYVDGATVNATKINSVAASSVTTINANLGTTQPVNFTGTAGSALVKSDAVDIAGAAVSTSSAQIGVNVVNAGGTAWGSGAITAAAIASNAITAAKIATDAIGSAQLATSAVDEIVDATWDEALSGHTTAGTTGKALSDAGSAGDPWGTALPGAYGAGTAGNIVGNNLDAAVSTRAVAGDAMALTSSERNSTADALLDRSNAIETGSTPRGALRLMLAALAGKLSGAAGTTVTFRNAVADSKNRIVATVDVNGNRTAVSTDQT